MKNDIKKRQDILGYFIIRVFAPLGLTLFLTACGGNGSPAGKTVELSTENTLDLYCTDVGIANNGCVLYDPQNPYANSLVNEDNKWDLSDASPSAKSRFYVWATAMAHDPKGVNQYLTAVSLHELYTEGLSLNAKEQAIRAYRSVLDNYYDSLLYYTGNVPLDLLADVDFFFDPLGSGSALDGAYSDDEGYSPVFQVIAGSGWGAPTAALAFTRMSKGLIANYENLVFKIKGLPTTNVTVKFEGNGAALEKVFSLDDYATPVEGKEGWSQVTIPLSEFPDTDKYTLFIIHGGFGNGGEYLLTDVAFTGDAVGTGLVRDGDDDGYVYFYKSEVQTQVFSLLIRHLVGINLIDPSSADMLPLFDDASDANDALSSWGYTYDAASKTISKNQ